jgi:hypothetical protein
MRAGPPQSAKESAKEHDFREDEPAHAPAERQVDFATILTGFTFVDSFSKPLEEHEKQKQHAKGQGVTAPVCPINPLART